MIETKIESNTLSIRLDSGNWIVLASSVQKVISSERFPGPLACGSVTYLSEWGVKMTQDFALRTPKRIG